MSYKIKISKYSKYFAVDTPSRQTEEYKCIRALRRILNETVTKELADSNGRPTMNSMRLDTWVRQHQPKTNVTPVIEKITDDIVSSLDDCLKLTKYRRVVSFSQSVWNLFQMQEGAASVEYFRTKFGRDMSSCIFLCTNPDEHYLHVEGNDYLEVLNTNFAICTDKFVDPLWVLLVDELGFWKLWHDKQCHSGRFVNELKPLVEKLIGQNHH